MGVADTMRRRPEGGSFYRAFVVEGFDPATTTAAERNLTRWLYRQLRKQQHSTPFAARALTAVYVIRATK